MGALAMNDHLNRAGVVFFSLWLAGSAGATDAQPEAPKNLKYFPKEITRAELIPKMRQFSFALGVPCTHCHGTKEQTTFDLTGVDFSTDLKPTKAKARDMLRMTDEINTKLLAPIPHSELNLKVTCFTCHSGLALPESIEARVLRIVKTGGVDAAVADYRSAREKHYGSAAYNFKEQPLVEAATSLRDDGQLDAAVAIAKLNLEFYPESGQSKAGLAEAYFKLGDTKSARPLYEEMLKARPGAKNIQARLDEIDKLERAAAEKAASEKRAP
jgi:tetratricopeptide (TPR) repeat protein